MMDANRMSITHDGVHHVLRQSPTTWERRVAADLVEEMQPFIGKEETLPDIRRHLAIEGYRGLRCRIEDATIGLSEAKAVTAMAHAMRGYALAKPGLAAASFRTLDVNSPEWEIAGAGLAQTVMRVFQSHGLHGPSAAHAALILRCLVRGFVVNEMSTPNSSLDFHESFAFAVRVFIHGLPELQRGASPETRTMC